LVADYAAYANPVYPQKEYGYRNGQLLITAEAQSGSSTNVALAANGGVAVASTTLAPYYPAYVTDGSRRAVNSAGWLDNTYQSFPDWIEVDFNASKTISEIDVITQQDDYQNPIEPTLTKTFSLYGITAFDVQYWNGSAWVTVPNGSVTGNNKVWRQFTFTSITTSKIRVVVNAGADNAFSRVVEVEAWTASGSPANLNWLVTDQLGTPRMVFDKTGALATVKRHDYLPFGEELSAGQGVRTTTLGYGAVDGIRQKFTSQERDNETGLDYMHARYFASAQGRFSSADTVAGSIGNPQSLNRYAYVNNNPLNFTDPTGHMPSMHMNPKPGSDGGEDGYSYSWDDPNSPQAVLQDLGYTSADRIVSSQLNFSPAEDPGFVPYYSILYGGLGAGQDTGSGNAEYGRVEDFHRSTIVTTCQSWFVVGGIPILPQGAPVITGVYSDVFEATIAHSSKNVGEPSNGKVDPALGVWGNDARAHLGAAALGGKNTPINLTSQNKQLNNGAIKSFEYAIRRTLTNHPSWTAHLKIEMSYNQPPTCNRETFNGNFDRERSFRPTLFSYSVYYMTSDNVRVRGDEKPFVNLP
jgi:RHS repeat-associated protein